VAGDYGALAIDSSTGKGSSSGDVNPIETLAASGQTMLAAVGVAPSTIATQITGGKVIAGALA
jgi:hypothetical protein